MVSTAINAQNDKEKEKEFRDGFNKARELLYFTKFKEALPILAKLDSIDPANPNLHYLIGVCHIALSDNLEEGIKRLEYSSKYVITSYHSGYHSERRVPIYAWYYLGVGYCFTNQCEKAVLAFASFKSYISDPGDSYVADAEGKLVNCKAGLGAPVMSEQPAKEEKKEVADVGKVKEEVKKADTREEKTSKPLEADPARQAITTRTILYTTRSPLYAVQVGAYDKLLPSNEFKNLKNVHSFIDKRGMVRYVVGHCVLRSQAENLMKVVREAGYKDAFIVDVNTEEKYSEEVMHQSKKTMGKKEYRVQLGVFRKEIPEDLAKIFLKIDNVKETHEGELTVLTSGSFKDHESASQYRNEMISKGVPGAFVVVFVNGRRQALASITD